MLLRNDVEPFSHMHTVYIHSYLWIPTQVQVGVHSHMRVARHRQTVPLGRSQPLPFCQWDSLDRGRTHLWELSSDYRDPHGLQSRTYLLSGPLLRKFVDPCIRTSSLSSSLGMGFSRLLTVLGRWDFSTGSECSMEYGWEARIPWPWKTQQLPPTLPGPVVEPSCRPSLLALSHPSSQGQESCSSLGDLHLDQGLRGWGGSTERKKRAERETKQNNAFHSKCVFTLKFQNT